MPLNKIKNDVFDEMLGVKLWSYRFTGNCLPASLQGLSRVRSIYPNAKVVIGRQSRVHISGIDPIILFKDAKIEQCPSFHAWIDLGNGDVFDMVGPSCYGKSDIYWDKKTAKKYDKEYFDVLSKTSDVYRFYIRLKWSQQKKKYRIKSGSINKVCSKKKWYQYIPFLN